MRKDSRWASEAGGVLVETIVSAVVIAVVVLGVFASLDASSRSSGREKARSVAMSLAEQDQERLRGMRVAELSTLNTAATRDVPVGDIVYKVESEADWLRDAGGTPSCTNDARQADYLKIRSTVTSKTDGATPPVTLRSTVNPPVAYGKDSGTLAVKVVDRAGVGVPNMPVAITGGRSETTNAAGCALFNYIRQAPYDITLNQPGWVNFAGETLAVTRGVQVNAGKVNVASVTYDRAGSVDVSTATFVKVPATAPAPTPTPSGDDDDGCGDDDDDDGGACPAPPSTDLKAVGDQGQAVIAAHQSLPTAVRLFTETTPSGSIMASNLFPFTSPYALYSGRCQSQNPELYVANYFASQNGRVQVEPGGAYAVTVLEPSLNIVVKRSGVPMPRAGYAAPNVVVTHASNGCTDTIAFKGSLTAESAIHPATALDEAKRGTLKRPGIPFGTYSVCVDDGVRNKVIRVFDNKAVAGTPRTEINVTGDSTTGLCA